MMDFIKENKAFAGIVVGIIVLTGGYFAYNSGTSDELLSSTSQTSTAEVSKELLATLGNLKSLSLDVSIFTDTAFMSLVDFGVAIPLEPVGRDNPFAPLSKSGTRTTAAPVSDSPPTRTFPVPPGGFR